MADHVEFDCAVGQGLKNLAQNAKLTYEMKVFVANYGEISGKFIRLQRLPNPPNNKSLRMPVELWSLQLVELS